MAELATIGRGYAHRGYAASLSEFGRPRPLPRCGGTLLERAIAGTTARDLIGSYPLFSCVDWSGLRDDIDELDDSMVSVVVVVDPLSEVADADLERAFPDLMQPFKPHFIRDLDEPVRLPRNHRRDIRRGMACLDVEVCADPLRYLDDWTALYAGLVRRHGVTGIRAFSRESFRRQLSVPGLVALRAALNGRTVAMRLLFEDTPCAYDHLAAQSDEGYEACASYVLLAVALEHLRERGVRCVDLGGVPATGSSSEGLVRFKVGWATGERAARLCGRILNPSAYAELAARRGTPTAWFPQYRAGERDFAQAPQDAGERRCAG